MPINSSETNFLWVKTENHTQFAHLRLWDLIGERFRMLPDQSVCQLLVSPLAVGSSPLNSVRAAMTSLNPNALAEAQSSSEMFDVMRPPRPSFDVYRDRPEPTGETMTRGETHALKRWHRSVHVWLVDPALGLLALQKRSPNKDTFPGRWDISAAGHIESGDESRPTAVRELAEELGVICDGEDLRFLMCVPAAQADAGGCNCFEDVYILRSDSTNTAFAVGEAEVTATAWMAMKELEEKLKTGDPTVVPRTEKYQSAFFGFLRAECGFDTRE